MDGFSYVNIFDTKGIEYLVIIAFLLLLVPFWLILNRQANLNRQMKKVLGILSEKTLQFPMGVFHHPSHTWTFLERSGIAKVGLDDLMLHILGDIHIRYLKNPGEQVTKGERITQIEQGNKTLEVYSPVSGSILQTNELIVKDDQVLSRDPYGQGWLYRIKPAHWISDTYSCYMAEDTTEWMHQELSRYKDFLAKKAAVYSDNPALTVLQDGGELADASLSGFPAELWSDFQQEFLDPAHTCNR